MLQIEIRPPEMFDERTNRFVPACEKTVLRLEHSLVSLSKWESRWKVPFINHTNMTQEQNIDYIRCMTITQCVDPNVYQFLSEEDLIKIRDYIDDKMTATWFTAQKKGGHSPVVTSELIYYWMTVYGIPFDPCEKWHLNRLLTLIRVCDEKEKPSRKMSKRDSAAQYRDLNNLRRARHGGRG